MDHAAFRIPQHRCKELAERHMSIAAKLPHNGALPDRDLAVFLAGTTEMDAYRHDLDWAQEYAARNRQVMLTLVCNAVRDSFPPAQSTFRTIRSVATTTTWPPRRSTAWNCW